VQFVGRHPIDVKPFADPHTIEPFFHLSSRREYTQRPNRDPM
jgi:hypothetical protein